MGTSVVIVAGLKAEPPGRIQTTAMTAASIASQRRPTKVQMMLNATKRWCLRGAGSATTELCTGFAK
jgi:hypothetical protein